MPDCNYCEESFDSEEAYLAHLRDRHADELGLVDQRRIGETEEEDSESVAAGPVVVGVIIIAALAGVVYFVVSSGGGGGSASASGPQNIGGAHYHGEMIMTVDGQSVDFSQQRYQLQDQAFHFEAGNGRRWHGHAPSITLEYAIETLGIDVTESSIVYDDTVYNRSEGDTVSFEVNGESVTPGDYVIEQGDQISITADTG